MAVRRRIDGSGQLSRFVSARKRRGRGRPKLQPPLTPMIDVTFQLLLFFILTTQFRLAEGQIPGTLPQSETSAVSAADIYRPIEIRLRPRQGAGGAVDGVLYELSGSGAGTDSPQRLYRQLLERREHLGSDQVPVIIKGPRAVPWRHVVEAMNAANRARFRRIGYAQPAGAQVP